MSRTPKQSARRGASDPRTTRPSRMMAVVGVVACLAALLVGCGATAPSGGPAGKAVVTDVIGAKTAVTFDPSVGAPLPDNRIVAAYGIAGGEQVNGPASTLDMLDAYLPQLQQLGQQYAALDPTHPVLLGIDLVVNVFDLCATPLCSSWASSDLIDTYVSYCKQHNLLLFLDLQLGIEPVEDAVKNVLPYLQKYPFVELELDTEFHFPDTPRGHDLAVQYASGAMPASEVNWAISELAQVSLQNRLPRKVLVINQWYSDVFDTYTTFASDSASQKDQIKPDPNVSLVLQSDGFGYVSNKLGDYQVFVQQDLLEYGGYKLFYNYPGSASYDIPLQSPSDVMSIFPQPLFISYQ